MTVELPAGIQHGTPEGYAAGCKREKDCPALRTHGMCCLFAHVRSQTDPRYYKAKVRDPRPQAIAERLGIRPPHKRIALEEEQLDEEAAERSETQVFQPGRGWHKRPTDQLPVNKPKPRDSAQVEAPIAPPIKHQSTNPDPAQPLAEQSQDPDPQEDAGAPAIEDQTPTAETSDVEGEDMGRPTTTEETTVTTTAPDTDTDTDADADAFAARCAAAIATPAGRKKVRDWARTQGFEVPARGRIPSLYVRSYVQGTLDETPTAGNATPETHDETGPAHDATPVDDVDALAEGTVTVDGDLAIEVAEVSDPAPTPEPLAHEFREQVASAFAVGARVLEEPDAFRPDWASVTIPEDLRAVRLTAARLEEDNARLQAERDEAVAISREVTSTLRSRVQELEDALQSAITTPPPDDGTSTDPLVAATAWQLAQTQGQLAIAHTALELTLRKLAEEREARDADVFERNAQIGKLIRDRRILVASNKIRGTLIDQAHETVRNQAIEIRTLRATAALPFWRRRR